MKEILIFLGGIAVGICLNDAQAQQYVITNPQGYSQGTIQIQGTQGQIVDNRGYISQSLTIYPNQVVTQSGAAVGTSTGYTVPPVPMSPPSPRVLQ